MNCGVVNNHPMQWGLFSNLIANEEQIQLLTSYPEDGFQLSKKDTGPSKHYCFDIMPLVKNNIVLDIPLYEDRIWRDFISEISSKQYNDQLSQCLNIDLSTTKINIGLYRFKFGHWVEPHVDNLNKIVTQIFYFNKDWNIENGGFLQLLLNKNSENYFFSLAPLSIYSVAIVRGDSAWHSVTPINHLSLSRKTLQLEFYKD